MKIVYLTPKSSFRNKLRSDSLFGLLIWGIEKIYGRNKVEDLIEAYRNDKPPFLLSSAFPFTIQERRRTLYFPRPIVKPFRVPPTSETMALYKDYKKIRWLPEDIFQSFVSGEISESEFFLDKKWQEIKDPWGMIEQVMHNQIDRLNNASTGLFYTEEYYIQQGGLFFLVNVLQPGIESVFKGIFQFFEHIGLGGDASVGKGFFKIEYEDYKAPWLNVTAKHKLNLSLYYPQKDEITYYTKHERDTWYRLELRKGKVGGRLHVQANVWKKSVNVFSEGSVFPAIPNRVVYGDFPIVKEKKKEQRFNVYYYGFPIMVNFNMKG